MKKSLVILDSIQLALSVIGMFVFAFIFFVVGTMQRYLFLICLLYSAFVFISSWQSIELELAKREKKKSKVKVKNTKLKKISA